MENDKLFDLSDTTPLFKMEIGLVYTEENVCKDTKKNELQS